MDWVESLFASSGVVPVLTVQNLIFHLLIAFVLGQLTAWVYMWTHHGVSYSRSQVQSLILLCLIVTLVMLAVGNNVARAFGLFGALALIRFRTPIKDSRDTAFLFLAVCIGISVGTHNIMLAVIGTLFACLVSLYMWYVRFGERMTADGLLRFQMDSSDEHESALRRILGNYCQSFGLINLREAGVGIAMEFSYQLKLHDFKQSSMLLSDLRKIPGLTALNLLMQDTDEDL